MANRVFVIKQVSVGELDPGKSLETQELLLSAGVSGSARLLTPAHMNNSQNKW